MYLKRSVKVLYMLVMACMGLATVIEKLEGTPYVAENVYGAWWFTALWALLSMCGVGYYLRRRSHRWSSMMLHGSLVLILLGALLTHVTGQQGVMHVSVGHTSDFYTTDGQPSSPRTQLPMTVRLESFRVVCHEGTDSPADYVSTLTITHNGYSSRHTVSMNNIASVAGVRFYQSGYDPDERGTWLSVNSDPWGIPVTYCGYALLFLSLVGILVDPKGRYRRVLSDPRLRRAATVLAIVAVLPMKASALNTLTPVEADAFGRLNMMYNGRICPVETFALDLTRKLTGKTHYGEYSATQVLAGFLFWPEEWQKEPLDKSKGAKLEEHRMIMLTLQQMATMRLFPYDGRWYAPTDSLPQKIEPDRARYIHDGLVILGGLIRSGDHARFSDMLQRMHRYQYAYGAKSIPSPLRLKAEHLYNAVPFSTILFMVCLTMGFLSIVPRRWMHRLSVGVLALALVALTLCLALRWMVRGTIPMSNGYETMLLLAWLVMTVSLLTVKIFPVIRTFGLLLSGFFLLVSHISQMDPQISHVMPVLSSPLLSIHVSIIMTAYGLLSLTAICSLTGLMLKSQTEYMHLMAQVFLYPAMTCLGIGIFVGAIWANVSWGSYWSWDPKEVWALITMMLYAIPIHSQSIPAMAKPRKFLWFTLLAFLSVLVTYFGVNYILGGMHSYA